MLRFESIILREIRMPLKEGFRSAAAEVSERRILLVEAREAGGAVAWSECVATERPTYTPETVDTAWLALTEWLVPAVLGREFASPRAVDQALEAQVRGHPMARAALEMAAWGLLAEVRGEPLAALLGGERKRVEAGVALGLGASPEAVAERAAAELERGYRKVKLKIRPGADVEVLAAVREKLGPEAPLAADANGAYRLEDAEHLRRLDAFGLTMLEQPLAWDDLADHAALARQLATPLCLDESVRSVAAARHMIELGAAGILCLKPGRVGGLSAALEIHALCRAHGVPVWCGGMLESGIGRAYNVGLASLPGFTLPGDLSPSERYWHRDVVDPPWTMDAEGMVEVPFSRPGLGVDVDRERIEALAVRVATLG